MIKMHFIYKDKIKKHIQCLRMRVLIGAQYAFEKKLLREKQFLKLTFRLRVNKSLNLKRPKTFSEKLQWLKLYDRKDIYKKFADKFLVRDYVAEKIGKEYLIPLLGVWDNPDEIDFTSLPEMFMLKCNHGSGLGTFTFKIDSTTNRKLLIDKLKITLKKDYYFHACEWPYHKMDKKIIAEQMIETSEGEELLNYKFFCFNGEPKFLNIMRVDAGKTYVDYYNLNWERNGYVQIGYQNKGVVNYCCPKKFNEMVEIAAKLSEGVPFLRVDLYNEGDKIYFGELTLFPTAGYLIWEDKDTDREIGEFLKLPTVN